MRPTQDRVRESLFGSLAARLVGARFLDLFAGSGAAGLEARSRGAAFVQWVEHNRATARTLRENVRLLCGSDEGVVEADAVAFLRRWPVAAPFDLIFADPPYGSARRQARIRGGQPGETLVQTVMRWVAERAWLGAGGVLVLEVAEDETVAPAGRWRCVAEKRYGGTKLYTMVLEDADDTPGNLRGDV